MKLELPATAAIKRAGMLVGFVVLAALLLAGAFFVVKRLLPERDITPIVVARKDEQTAAKATADVGASTAAANRDATIHLDLTQKEIRDAFDAPQPVPSAAVAPVAPLPPAPVGRLRDRLNEGIARANRAADAAGPAD